MHVTIRPIKPGDEPFLWRMLYHSLFVPPGQPALPPEVTYQPRVARYVAGWGRDGDQGVLAVIVDGGAPVGAAWLRRWSRGERGFGYLDEHTPELAVAVLPEARGLGVGTALLKRLLALVAASVPAVSLSVDPRNPAVRLYRRLGFEVVAIEPGSWVMRWRAPGSQVPSLA
jgi:GNAT superfamily N-acetyltransferase